MASFFHDVPILGHFSLALHNSFGQMFGNLSYEEMTQAFKDMDKNQSGTLDKTEIAEALRKLGKSEREVQNLIDSIEQPELTISDFRELLTPASRHYTTTVTVGGMEIPVPNLRKVHDVPLVGGLTAGADSLVTSSVSWSSSALGVALGSMNDDGLRAKFDELDTDCSGRLDKKELAIALRNLSISEEDIKKLLDSMKGDSVDFLEFKVLVRPPPKVHDVPVIGHFTHFFHKTFSDAFGFDHMSEADLHAAFNKIDRNSNGTLDKTEVADALREMGRSEKMVQQLVDSMEKPELDIDDFKELVQPSRPYFTAVFGVPLPNIQKVHDVPVVGAVTAGTQNLVVGLVSDVGGAFRGAFSSLSDDELKAKFEELDTNKSGTLDNKEIAVALRELRMTEADIKGLLETMEGDSLDFIGFKKLVRG
eukprot:CAMPEP_0117473658 /NCGR_PEP_ID=MMETSP0784-20121206/8882_1 /TAXON_ID=39447 /ORGANISM="" /LENGTH=420 /DNA_ID=CAMNT_0005267859 /DNA_START=57 /DNA_END=1319 /DNA_ORIENTATION=+